MPGTFARVLHLPALPKRAGSPGGHRTFVVSAGVVALSTVVAASVALASSPDGHQHRSSAAQRVAAYPPSYTLPVGTLIATGKVGRPTMAGDTGSAGVPAGTPAKPTVPDNAQIPAQSAAIAGYQGGSGTLTPAGIATLAMEAGCSSQNAVIATAVSMAESGGSPGAQGDVGLMNATWDWSAGLWQIRGLRSERGTGELRDSVANQNAAKNAAAMYTISSGCTSWGPWTTYTRGLYAQYLSIATQAVNYVVRYFDAHGRHYPTVAAPDPNAPVPSGGGAGGGGAQAEGSAPTHATHSSAKSGKHPAAKSSTAAAAGGKGGGKSAGSGSGGGGGAAQASPTPAPTGGAGGGAASSITKPVKSAASKIKSAVSSVIAPITSIVPIPIP